MVSVKNMPTDFYFSGKGLLSIYDKKTSYKKPLILEIPIKSKLSVEGGLLISFLERDFIFESVEARQNLMNGFGLGFSPFAGPEFFNGSLMDEFFFDELGETTSTFIVGGDLISLGKARKASFIGNLKIIDGLIKLTTNFTLSNDEFLNSKPEFRPYSGKSKLIEFEIISELKFTA